MQEKRFIGTILQNVIVRNYISKSTEMCDVEVL